MHIIIIGNPFGHLTEVKTILKIAPVYGVYLDIDFSNKPLSQAFSFNYLPRNWPNAVPNEIVVYAGTSNDDLRITNRLEN